jgi:hypothetical protein
MTYQKPLTYSDLLRRIEALGSDPEEMSLEEISLMVKEVRQEMANHERASGH